MKSKLHIAKGTSLRRPGLLGRLHLGQGSRRHALADPLHVLAGRVELDVGQLREVCSQDLLGVLHHDAASMATGDAAQSHDILNRQVLAILRNRVPEVNADALVDLACLRFQLRILHGGLDLLQALGVRHVDRGVHVGVLGHHVGGEVDATLLCQPGRGPLPEVDRGVAAVRGPNVARALGVQVEGVVGVLVDPTRERAVLVDVAGALAAAEGDPEEAALTDHLSAGDGRDLAVVDHLQGHVAKLLGELREDGHDLLLVDIGGNVREAVAPRGLAVGGDGPRRAAADRLDLAGELGSCGLHRLDDDVVVVLRVRVRDVPLGLRRVQDLAVLDGDRLDIALAQVEGDAAAAGDLAADHGLLLRGRELLRLHHGNRPGHAVDLRHGGGLKVVLAALGVRRLELLAELGGAAEQQLEAAALPEHVPDALAGEEERGVVALVALREDGQLVPADASGPLHGEVQLGGLAEVGAVRHLPHVAPLPQHEGAEVRVQWSRHRWPRQQVLHGGLRHHGVRASECHGDSGGVPKPICARQN
mmetsp:Transcript_72600/g.192868  ORF Transcript_72600/g.192868 Transcript_72600/m.192868 type:complete len:532 (+) Transcript_72600:71-1666(+)